MIAARFILAAVLATTITAPSRLVHVTRVVDGDTLVVSSDAAPLTVRVLGIDCPESHRNAKCRKAGATACAEQIPAGLRATARAQQLLEGRDVTLEPDAPRTALKIDRYGRALAYVRLTNGTDFGRQMLQEGLCEDFGWKYPHSRGAEYRLVSK